MSGFEVAGIVLGSIPLIVKAIEEGVGFLKAWRKAPSELRSLSRQLTTERAKLYNVCDHLLSDDIVPRDEIESMLRDPFGPQWKAGDTKKRIRQRLWQSYNVFQDTLNAVREELESISTRLNVQISETGEIWRGSNWTARELKTFLYLIHRRDYADSIQVISKGIDNLENLMHSSVKHEPGRRKRSRCKVFTVMRSLSASFYRALNSSILCQHSHHICFNMEAPSIELKYEDEYNDIVEAAEFRLIVSFEETSGSVQNQYWDEIHVKPRLNLSMKRVAPAETDMERKENRKRVTFSMVSAFSRSSPAPGVKQAMASIARPITDVAFINTHEHKDTSTGALLDLCTKLAQPYYDRPGYYGHLVDGDCLENHFRIFPLGTRTNAENTWSVVTLQEILQQNEEVEPFFSLQDRVRLALIVASTVLQLSHTPWLPGEVSSQGIHFLNRGTTLSYQHPFLARTFSTSQRIPETSERPTGTTNPKLFALGILLLEIILGSTLEKLRQPQENMGFIDERTRDKMIARRLLDQKVSLIDTCYKGIIEYCLGCIGYKGLEVGQGMNEMYDHVVLKLENILGHTNI